MFTCVWERGGTQTGMENVDSIHSASAVIWTDSQRCVGIYRLNHIYLKTRKTAEEYVVMFSIWTVRAVETQSCNINISSGRFFPVLFVCYRFFLELCKFVRWGSPPPPAPAPLCPYLQKHAHIWIMTFLQELTAVCANHAYKSITEAYVL